VTSGSPDVLAPPTSLETLVVVADRAEELSRLLAAIDWGALPNLRRLSLAGVARRAVRRARRALRRRTRR
jgi:hypothetical protein